MHRPCAAAVTCLFLASCVTAHPAATPRPNDLPCTDNDAERCLTFLKLIDDANTTVQPALERYCLEGNNGACFALASRRRNHHLSQLCREGLVDACDLPPVKKTAAGMRADCLERGDRAACEFLLNFATAEVADLEASCRVGVALGCARLADALRAHNPADERAKRLSWRACLAGVGEACVASETNEAKCIKGAQSSCETFLTKASEPDAVRAHKVEVLQKACRNGAPVACSGLRDVIDTEALIALGCGRAATCSGVMNGLGRKTLVRHCGSAPVGSAERDAACHALVVTNRFTSSHDETDAEPDNGVGDRWLTEQLHTDPALFRQVRTDQHRFIEALHALCAVNACTGEERKKLEAVDACLRDGLREQCGQAVLWLRTVYEVEPGVANQVLTKACESGEGMFCVEAANHAESVSRHLALLMAGCRANDPPSCHDAEVWRRADADCTRGQCRNLAKLARYLPETVTRLIAACERGSQADCEAWRVNVANGAELSRLQWAESLILHPKLSAIRGEAEQLANGKRACDEGSATGCGAFLGRVLEHTLANDDSVSEVQRLVGWALMTCRGKVDRGCLALTSSEAHRAEALETSCELGNGDSCGDLAHDLWDASSPTQRREPLVVTDPGLVRARALALKGCELKSAGACKIAADFVESGIGGSKDELEAARLKARGKSLNDR